MTYTIRPINNVIHSEKKYLSDLRSGVINPIITPYNFINTAMLNGLHPTDVVTIAGLSGTGKTTFLMILLNGIVKHNLKVRLLVHSFEMSAGRLLSKNISKKVKSTLKELYDQDATFNLDIYDTLKDLPIDFVESPGTVDQIAKGVDQYEAIYPDHTIIPLFDHTLLVEESTPGESERVTLKNLCKYVNKDKKTGRRIYVLLSQLNDAMLNPKRMQIPSMHYPNLTDLFGGRALWHVSDLMIILVNPIDLNLPTPHYGNLKLPLSVRSGNAANPNSITTETLIYAHVSKARNGQQSITPLINRLHHNDLRELSAANLAKFWSKIKQPII